jgi:hypothetical protein
VTIIQKGYGEVKMTNEEILSGEVTLYGEGWIAVVAYPPVEGAELRWFPRERVIELIWKKYTALRRPS